MLATQSPDPITVWGKWLQSDKHENCRGKVCHVRKLWWQPRSVVWRENPQTGLLKLKANKLEAAIHLLSTWSSWENLKTSRKFRRLFSRAGTKRGNQQAAGRAKWNANHEEALDVCRSSCSWAARLISQLQNWSFMAAESHTDCKAPNMLDPNVVKGNNQTAEILIYSNS